MGDLYAAQIVCVGFYSYPGVGACAVPLAYRVVEFSRVHDMSLRCNETGPLANRGSRGSLPLAAGGNFLEERKGGKIFRNRRIAGRQ
jgi:hypothetical protein